MNGIKGMLLTGNFLYSVDSPHIINNRYLLSR